jgi:sigma-B regulation protein RsbU (phosphoserine phosphatase)
MVKIAVASQRHSLGRPAHLLRDVNRVLCGSFQRGFVPATYAWIGGGELVVANAGHPGPLLRRDRDGGVREVGGRGPLLGRFAGGRYAEERIALEPGDRLVLYTDGVTAARAPDGELFGEERLRFLVGQGRQARPEDFCDALLEDLRGWTAAGAHLSLEDDVTLVVVDVEGSG